MNRLYNLPIVHECGKWVDYLSEGMASYARYFMSRLSQFIDYGHELDFEREIAISRAMTIGKFYDVCLKYLYVCTYICICR